MSPWKTPSGQVQSKIVAALNRVSIVAPLVCSALAFAIVVGSLLAGAPPQRDEGAAAHLFQLLIVVQLPLIVLFVVTRDRQEHDRCIRVLILHVLGIGAAMGSLALSGY